MLEKKFFFACFFFLKLSAFSQQLQFTSYTSAQGLSQNSVYSIAQTKEGFIWLGTQDGLNRFDGRNIWHPDNVPVLNKPGERPVKTYSKMFTALYATAEDKLLTGTTNQLLIYDRYRNCYLLPDAEYPGFEMPDEVWIKKIAEDKQQRIWVLTTKKGLFVYDKVRKKMLVLNKQPPGISDFSVSRNGTVWAAAGNNIYYVEGLAFVRLKTTALLRQVNVLSCVNDELWLTDESTGIYILSAGQPAYTITAFTDLYPGNNLPKDPSNIMQSDDSTLWIGSRSSGVIKINMAAHVYESSMANNITTGLRRQFVLNCFTDASSSVWVGLSGGGAVKYTASKNVLFDLWRKDPDIKNLYPDNMCLSIFSLTPSQFYIGTLTAGLMYLNTGTGEINYYIPPVNDFLTAESKNIYSIIKGNDNLLWMATWGGLYSFNIKTKFFTQYVDKNDRQTTQLCSVIKLKHSNRLLVGGFQGEMRMFNPVTKQFEKCFFREPLPPDFIFRVRYMQEGENGEVYMSTETQSFISYNYLTGTVTRWPQFQAISGASRFFCFHKKDLWIATDDGLILADAGTKKIVKHWNTLNGLSNNVIYGIAPDGDDKIWESSNGGLCLLNTKTGTITNYLEADGLQSNEFNTACCIKDEQGRIWFGGINGINRIKNAKAAANSYRPQTLITGFSVMNQPYKTDSLISYVHQPVQLSYNRNFIAFEFTAAGFARTNNIRYQYKMSGTDTGWIDNGARNYVNYAQLKPGRYNFVARAISADNEEAEASMPLTIIIAPAWYNTTIFYLLLVLAVAGIVYALFRYRINQVKQVHALQQRISADLHDDIGASLTSINILSKLSNQKNIDVNTRNAYLEKIDKQTAEVTESLRDIVWSINPKNESLENIISRMKRYAAEMFETKNISYSFESAIEDENISLELPVRQNLYFIFKEAVNNLVKYSGASSAHIRLYRNRDKLCMEITDNGTGFNAETVKHGNGLGNMQRRAQAIQAVYELHTSGHEGTQIKLIIPL